jgi:hypothetical protein
LMNGVLKSPPVMKMVLVGWACMLMAKRRVIGDKSIFFIEERRWFWPVSY